MNKSYSTFDIVKKLTKLKIYDIIDLLSDYIYDRKIKSCLKTLIKNIISYSIFHKFIVTIN